MTVPAGSDLVDPLQVASDAFEGVAEAPHTDGESTAFDPQPGAPDPLAVLSRAIDAGQGIDADEPGTAKRGLLGRLGRGRLTSSRTAPAAAEAATDPATAAGPTIHLPQEPPAALPDEPRVTTWAEEFELASTTGEWPAVVADQEVAPPGDGAEVTSSAPTPPPAGRRRRRTVDAVTLQQGVAPLAEPQEDRDVAGEDSAGAERARLVAVRGAAERHEADRLAVLKGEEDLHRVEYDGAELAATRAAEVDLLEGTQATDLEADRQAAEQAEADRIDADRAAAQQAEDDRLEQLRLVSIASEERWLAAEQAEADRIDADRAAAQQAEDDRLEELRLEQLRVTTEQAELAERARLAAVREASEQAERDRALRAAEETRTAQERLVEQMAAAERAEREREARQAAARESAASKVAPAAVAKARSKSAAVGAEPIPRFIEFRSTSVLRYVFGALFVVCAVAAVIAIFRAVSAGSGEVIVAAAGLTALAMLSWWAVLSWTPPIVSISNGLLEITRGAKALSWDLRDPATEITFRGRPSSRSWRAILRDATGRPATISARHVDPLQFVEVVEHYQSVGPETEA
jgi:hypothetical protein